jgi:glycerol uptake facilitator protein
VGGIFYKLFVGVFLPEAEEQPPGRAPIPDEA